RARLCQPADRRGADRDDLLLAGAWPLHLPQRSRARLPGHYGHHARRRRHLPDHQPPDRHQLRAARSAGGAMTAADVAAIPARKIAPARSKTRRWFRRYGLPAFGGLIIVAWIVVAALAPLLSPYVPTTVEVTARLRPPSAQHWLGTDVL